MNQAEKELEPPEPLVVKELDFLGKGEGEGFEKPLESSKSEDSSQESPGNAQKKEETLNGPETPQQKLLPPKGLLEKTKRLFNLPPLEVGIDQKGDILGGADRPIAQKEDRFSVSKASHPDQGQGFLPMRKPHPLPIKSDIRMTPAKDFTQAERKPQGRGQERKGDPFREKESILPDTNQKQGLVIQEEIKGWVAVSSPIQDKDPFSLRKLCQAFDPEEDEIILALKSLCFLAKDFVGDGKDAAFRQRGVDAQKPVAFHELFSRAVSYGRQGLQLLGVRLGEIGDVHGNQRLFSNLAGHLFQVSHPKIGFIPMRAGQGPEESSLRGLQLLRAYFPSRLSYQRRARSQDSLHQLGKDFLSGLIHFFQVRSQIVVEFFLGTVDDRCRKFHVALLWVSGLCPKQPSALRGGLFIAYGKMYKL